MKTIHNPDFRINWKSKEVLEIYDGKKERIAWLGMDDMYLHEAKTVLPEKKSSHRGCDLPLFCWFQYLPGFAARKPTGFELRETGPERVTMALTGTSEDGAVFCRTELSIGIDRKIFSYFYQVKMDIEVQKDGRANYIGGKKGMVEFVNFYPLGAANSRKKLWQRTIYSSENGSYYAIPHNHIPSSDKYNFTIPKGGIIGFFNEEEGNPVIEVSQKTESGVCWMWYDNHLCLPVTSPEESGRIPPGTKMRAEYRLVNLSSEKGATIVKKAKQRLVSDEEKKTLIFPKYKPGVNSFEEAVVPGTVDCSSFWARGIGRFDEGIGCGFSEAGLSLLKGAEGADLVWVNDISHCGSKSLRISTNKNISCAWLLISGGWPNEGVVWGQAIQPGRKHLFSGYVRTENLEGEGAYLACVIKDKYSNILKGGSFVSPKKLTGNNGWTKLELLISEVPGEAAMLDLVLQHSGRGTSWFDDVKFAAKKR